MFLCRQHFVLFSHQMYESADQELVDLIGVACTDTRESLRGSGKGGSVAEELLVSSRQLLQRVDSGEDL